MFAGGPKIIVTTLPLHSGAPGLCPPHCYATERKVRSRAYTRPLYHDSLDQQSAVINPLLVERWWSIANVDERVCFLHVRERISRTTRRICTKLLVHDIPMAAAWSSSRSVAITYVLPVLWMTSYLRTMSRMVACRYSCSDCKRETSWRRPA